VQVTADNNLVAMAPVLLLAVKPQILAKVVAQLSASNPQQLVISILAGVSIAQLEQAFPDRAVIRAMPNTPATVGMGMTAISAGNLVSPEQLELATQLFQAIGEVVTVPESLMDAVTGLSGSGPAYVAMAIEALADGGVAAGLPRQIADRLALQTVLGTAQLLKESKLHPAQLKDRVTSPGGTTIAGVRTLEQGGFRSALIEAVIAAANRSEQLGRDSG
jgi:pyrroline-5-carboxylate reductase